MGARDGSIGGLHKIVDAGSISGKWNLVIVAEGYQAGELGDFDAHARAFAATLLATPPFPALVSAINVFRLDVSSRQSGADAAGSPVATFFDACFCDGTRPHYLTLDAEAVIDAVEAALPQYDAIAVVVNTTTYGGSGLGQVATFSRARQSHDIGLHELGHSAFGLADEYSEGLSRYPGPEPAAANVTIQKRLANLKWKALVNPGTQIPTATNPGCAGSAAAPAQVAAIGTYEGARRYDCRAFRPAYDCKMRTLNAAFCEVCSAHIRKLLAPFLTTT